MEADTSVNDDVRVAWDWTDSLHIARRTVRQAVQSHAHEVHGWLLDIGCGGQPYCGLLRHVERYIALDLFCNHEVDVCGDGLALPFSDTVFDSVLCSEVLEHVPEPCVLMREVWRVLKPGGVLLLIAPQTWGLHAEPYDFYRYTKYGLQYLAEKAGLEVVELDPTCGFWATAVQRFADTVVSTYGVKRSRWLIDILTVSLAPLLMFGYGLDTVVGPRGDTLDYVMVARRRSRCRKGMKSRSPAMT